MFGLQNASRFGATPISAEVVVPFENVLEMESCLIRVGVKATVPRAARFGAAEFTVADPAALASVEEEILADARKRRYYCGIQYVARWEFMSRARVVGNPDAIGL